MKFLIIEDDKDIQSLIQHALKDLTNDLDFSTNSQDAINRLASEDYQLIVLDLHLENSDGRDVLRYLSMKNQNLPVVILSASNGIDDRIEGLGLGADDYITKPFSGIELQLRANGLLRRTLRYKEVVEVGHIKLNRLKREVYCDGHKTDFQTREFKVLEFLMSNPDKLISKELLISEVWGLGFSPQTNVVDVMICRVRSKIERQGFPRQLETIRGGGYIFHSFVQKKPLPSELTKKPSYANLASWP
ncbi:response regulator transcription factor [Bdellovibrio sp. SKB1291214]|uniref:response regulator transcription factor n=1 Tax=Bdellovibrio sp. SKB1291214 TaxID=1732569 RepID=UPI000B51A9BC|nr:response regulator transcription factor [Bdellovibrio sp. SKB1291214]UYL09106.1 response regulator transcription factor [Bdellovibrio sp. SKB1291214]